MTTKATTEAPAPRTLAQVWQGVAMPTSRDGDNSAALLAGQRVAREANAATEVLAVERHAKMQREIEANWSQRPRALTAEEQADKDQRDAYTRRFRHALGHSVKVATGPTPLPEPPSDE